MWYIIKSTTLLWYLYLEWVEHGEVKTIITVGGGSDDDDYYGNGYDDEDDGK